MSPLTDLVGSTEFLIGLLMGTIALLVALPAALGLAALRRTHGRRPGLVGPAFVLASVFAMNGSLGTDEVVSVPEEVVFGLLLLWLAGAIAARTAAPWLVGPIASLPGGFLLAGANVGLGHVWVPVVMVLATAIVGGTAADLDRRAARYGLGPLLFLVAVGGIYFTVPDTEIMRAIVGVALPLVLLAWPYAAASLGAGGAYAAVGLLLWIAPIEGLGRPGAIVGVVGAFALLVGEPIGRALVPRIEQRVRLHRYPIGHPRGLVVGSQVVLTFYATRVAGMVQTALAALLLMIPAVAAAVAFGVYLVIPERGRRRRKRKRRRIPSARDPAPAATRASSHPSSRSPNPPGPRPGSNGSSKRGSNGHGGSDG
jgi:hypothetical protein